MSTFMPAARNRIWILLIAAAVDLAAGDPHWLWHPVQGIGALISKTESVLRGIFGIPWRPGRKSPGPEGKSIAHASRSSGPAADSGKEKSPGPAGNRVAHASRPSGPTAESGKEKPSEPAGNSGAFHRRERAAGAVLVLLVLAVSTGAVLLILSVCQRIHPGLGIAAEGILCGRLLALRSLGEAGFSVRDPLIKGDVESARQAVSMIVGRDTERLDAEGIAKAAVETVAENTSDGVTAPLFYMILFGGAGGIFYKAVNTMDSMIGYKNDRYRFFGTAAARLDDVMNYVPSRLTALLMILSCAVPFRGALARTSSPGRLSTLDALSAETPPASGTVSAAASPSASGRIPAEGSLPASGRNPAGGSLPASGSVSSAEAFPPAPAAVSAAEQQRKRKTGAQKPAGERVLPDMRAAFSVWRRDRAKSPSPNSAQTESVCAGALHLRLLGDTWYFGELHHKDEIGDGARKVEPADITRAVYLMVRASILLFAAGIAALALFSGI